jgi:hypothetical protein
MHTTILAALFGFSRTASSMCTAGVVLFVIALWAAETDIAQVRGLDKIVALSNLSFAAPLESSARCISPPLNLSCPWRPPIAGFAINPASDLIAHLAVGHGPEARAGR